MRLAPAYLDPANYDDLDWLDTAHHEAGHAVAEILAGGTVRTVVVYGPGNGEMLPMMDGPQGDLPGHLTMILAGQEAGVCHLTGTGRYNLRTARDATARGARSDLRLFRRRARRSGLSEHAMRARARTLVVTHWDPITRIAADLLNCGRLRDRDVRRHL